MVGLGSVVVKSRPNNFSGWLTKRTKTRTEETKNSDIDLCLRSMGRKQVLRFTPGERGR